MHGAWTNNIYDAHNNYYFIAPADEEDFPKAINITRQTQAICNSSNGTTINVSASGPGTLSYAWKKDGDIITSENYPHCSGFDSDTLTISPFTILDEGNYSCVISNEEGLSIESELTTVKGMQKTINVYIIYVECISSIDCLVLILFSECT